MITLRIVKESPSMDCLPDYSPTGYTGAPSSEPEGSKSLSSIITDGIKLDIKHGLQIFFTLHLIILHFRFHFFLDNILFIYLLIHVISLFLQLVYSV